MNAAGVLSGLAVTVIAGEILSPLLAWAIDRQFRNPPVPTSGPLPEEFWREMFRRRPGGNYVGRTERLVFYGSFVAGAMPLAIAWLVFKVANNWQGANTLNRLPAWLVDDESKNPEILRARLFWASRVVVSFLAGTGLNVAIAFAGAGVAYYLGAPHAVVQVNV